MKKKITILPFIGSVEESLPRTNLLHINNVTLNKVEISGLSVLKKNMEKREAFDLIRDHIFFKEKLADALTIAKEEFNFSNEMKNEHKMSLSDKMKKGMKK